MASAEDIQIGTGTNLEYKIPVNMWYNYSMTQQIYRAAEIGKEGYITSISFQYDYSAAFTMPGVQVYLTHVTKDNFNSVNDFVSVNATENYFTGTFSASGPGWVTITLDRPFYYNGVNNLLVCLLDPTSGYHNSNYKFRVTSYSGLRVLTYYSDNNCPDISNLGGFEGNKETLSTRNNIKLHFHELETSNGETTVQIGDGATEDYRLPVNMYYNYSLTQQIYHSHEIGGKGTIYTIGFDYAHDEAFSLEGIQVYMKNVRKGIFNDENPGEDHVEIDESDKVFEGTFSATGPGWVTLTLDTPFEYDGNSELLVCMYDPTNGYPGSTYKFNCTTGMRSTLIYFSDTKIPNLSNLSGFTGSIQVLSLRANIRIGFTPGSSVQIGNADTPSYHLPVNTYFNYSLTQQIFTANEIGTEGIIHSLSFHYAYDKPLYMTGLQVYLKHVDKTSFTSTTDMVAISASDLVYEGDFSASGEGWTTLTFDTPFEYDGISNLLVCFYDPVYGYLGSSYKFYTSTTSNYATLEYYHDTYSPDITNVSSYSGNKYRLTSRSDIRFGITPTITIGTGTNTDYHVPFNSLYNYSFVEQLYSADEIGSEGLINSISFKMANDSPQTNSVTVYMKHVARNHFANNTNDYEPVSTIDIVYEGDWTLNQGWNTITLDRPFEYDGTSNLLIAIDENTPSYSLRRFYISEKDRATFCFYSDAYNPNPYNLSSFNGSKNFFDIHAQLRLDITPFGEGYCRTPRNITVSAQPNAIVMDWDTEGDTYMWFWKDATETTPASGMWGAWFEPPCVITQYKPSGSDWTYLEPGATYCYQMISNCGGVWDSPWTPIGYITLPEEQSFPIDFETSYLNQFPFNNNVSEYPWIVTDSDAATGAYCMMSSNQGIQSSVSAIEAMYEFEEPGYVSFDAKCLGEGTTTIYDACTFEIDGEEQFCYGEHGDSWNSYFFTVTAGTHTFRWKYRKDDSWDYPGDSFYVDNIYFGTGAPCIAPTQLSLTALTGNDATLSWNGNAESFKLRYRLGSGSWTTKSNITANTYTINNLAPGDYQAQVWATCDADHKVSTDFTITEILSNADWYGYAVYAVGGENWSDKFIQFTMHDPSSVTAVSNVLPIYLWTATYANGYVWMINDSRDLIRATFDHNTHSIGDFETVVTGFDNHYIHGMSFNPTNGLIYYIEKNSSYHRLKYFNPNNPDDIHLVGGINAVVSLAINNNGDAYCISPDGSLYTVDLTNASTTLVGSTGREVDYYQSMAFDMETGELFWAQLSSETDHGLYKVDTETGHANLIGQIGSNGAQLVGLFMVPAANEAPVTATYETGDLSEIIFNNSVSSYPWVVTNSDAASGSYCMMSSNQGVVNSTSTIKATCHFSEDGYVYFDAKCMGEGPASHIYDECRFYIDDELQFGYGALGNTWEGYHFMVTAGTHNFCWEYYKDGSYNAPGDTFYVDNLTFGLGSPCIAPNRLSATGFTLNSATLKWNGFATTYKLRYRLNGGSWTTKSNITANTYTISNLAPGTYQAEAWGTCDASHKASTTFTIGDVQSTAEWYGFAYESYGNEAWENAFIRFTAQNPGTVTAASNTVSQGICNAATYANGYVWAFNNQNEFLYAPFDQATHSIGDFVVTSIVLPPYASITGMAYNPADGNIFYIAQQSENYVLRRFNPDNPNQHLFLGYLYNIPARTLSINNEGEAYSIGWDGNLYSINLDDHTTSLIGNTGLPLSWPYSSAFDMETGELFFAHNFDASNNGFYKINTETGVPTYIGKISSGGAQLTGLLTVPSSPEITFDLGIGWTWFSSYVEYDANSLDIFKDAISDAGVNTAYIKSQNGFIQFDQGVWGGSVSLVNENMYMSYLDKTLSLTLTGPIANPGSHTITLNPGWKWISFLSETPLSVQNALVNLTPRKDDVIKGQGAYATYTGSTWAGSLTQLQPGKGYMYLNSGTSIKTFTYPNTGKELVTVEEPETHWKHDVHDFANNLCVTVSVDDLSLSDGSHEIGAFVNGTCRGSARIQTVEGFDTPMAFLTVSGLDGETVRFKVFDVNTEMEVGEALECLLFTSDALYGSLDQPYLLHLDANEVGSQHDQVRLFPNPTKDKINLQASDIQSVKLYNALGQCLYSKEFNHANQVELDLSAYSAGVYTLTVRSREDKISNLRVVRQ